MSFQKLLSGHKETDTHRTDWSTCTTKVVDNQRKQMTKHLLD